MTEIYRSAGILERLTRDELLSLYNSLASSSRQVTEFPSHAHGVQQCLELLAKKAQKKQRRGPFNCPFLGRTFPFRRGSKRERIADMLRNGCTIAEIQEMTGWKVSAVRNALRAIHQNHGYGLTENAMGTITLIEE